jgi:hypothetical protein
VKLEKIWTCGNRKQTNKQKTKQNKTKQRIMDKKAGRNDEK